MKFVFIGGKQPSAAIHTDVNGNITRDESKDPTDVPSECFAFGLTWQKGVPLDVTPDKFSSGAHYDNAIMRLQNNRFFERVVAEDAVFEEVAPDRPAKGKKGKAALPGPDEPIE